MRQVPGSAVLVAEIPLAHSPPDDSVCACSCAMAFNRDAITARGRSSVKTCDDLWSKPFPESICPSRKRNAAHAPGLTNAIV